MVITVLLSAGMELFSSECLCLFCLKNDVGNVLMPVVAAKQCNIEPRPFATKAQVAGKEWNSDS